VKNLRETNYGQAQGRKKGNVKHLEIPGTLMTKKLKEGESLNNVQQRVKHFFQKIKQEHKQRDNILIIAHSGTIKMILALSNNIHPRKIFKGNLTIKHGRIYRVKI